MTFQDQQFELARKIRTGNASGSERRRLNVYQELFFNNIEGFCSNGFPVLKSVLPESVWLAWIRSFLIHSECHSPFFVDIAEEFLSFLNETLNSALAEGKPEFWRALLPTYDVLEDNTRSLLQTVNLKKYPWLLELAHYEWVELFVSTQEPESSYRLKDLREFCKGETKLKLSASALPLAYQYPVQTIRVGHVENIKNQLTPLLVYQSWRYEGNEVHQGETQFVLVDVVSVHLLHFLQSQSASYTEMLSFLQSPTLALNSMQATEFLNSALKDFCERGVLISD